MKTTSVSELRDNLSDLLQEVAAGEVVEVVRYRTGCAYIVSSEFYELIEAAIRLRERLQNETPGDVRA